MKKTILFLTLLLTIMANNLFAQDKQEKKINIKENKDFFKYSKYIVEGKIISWRKIGESPDANYDAKGLKNRNDFHSEYLFVVSYVYRDKENKIKSNDTIVIVQNIGGMDLVDSNAVIPIHWTEIKSVDYSDGTENTLGNSKYNLHLWGDNSVNSFILFLNDSNFPENPKRKNNYLRTRFLENSIPSGFAFTTCDPPYIDRTKLYYYQEPCIIGLIGLKFSNRYDLYKYLLQFKKVNIPLSNDFEMRNHFFGDSVSWSKYVKDGNINLKAKQKKDKKFNKQLEKKIKIAKAKTKLTYKTNNDIYISVSSQQVTQNFADGKYYYEFDVNINGNNSLTFVDYVMVNISYDTNTFGSNIISEQKATVFLDNQFPTSTYQISAFTDFSLSSFAITTTTKPGVPLNRTQLTTTPKKLMHIKIELKNGLVNASSGFVFSFLSNMINLYSNTANANFYDTETYSNSYYSYISSILINTPNPIPMISTDLSVITKYAGVGDILTINGTNFGSQQGELFFTSPSRGGIINGTPDFTKAVNSWDILSWTDTEIKVRVPSKIYCDLQRFNETAIQGAGSGPIKIKNIFGDSTISSTALNIPYSIINVGGDNVTAPSRLYLARTSCDADYVFTLHTSIRDHSNKIQIIDAIVAAMNKWNTLLNIKLKLERDESEQIVYTDLTTSDQKNIIQIVPALADDKIMETNNSYASINSKNYRTFNSYIKISNTPGSYSWHYSITDPPANKVSFYNTFLHELGHIVCLQHNNDSSDLLFAMQYAGDPLINITNNSKSVLGASNNVTQSVNINWNNPYVGIIKESNNFSKPTITSSTGDFSLCSGGGTLDLSTQILPAPTIYKWSNGENYTLISVSNTGLYSVNVRHKGCVKNSDTINVTQNLTAPIIYSNNGISVICNSSPISLSVSPVDNTNYQWSTGETAQSITVNNVGNYVVTATNSNCSSNAVSEPFTVISDSLSASFAITPTSYNICTGALIGGSITTNVIGNAAPYSFCWHSSASPQTVPPSCNYTSQNLNNLESATYDVTITNSLGCSYLSSEFVPSGLQPRVRVLSSTLSINNCNANVNVSGGVKPYTYDLKWKCENETSTLAIDSITTNLQSYAFDIICRMCKNGTGFYILTITDDCGNIKTHNINCCSSRENEKSKNNKEFFEGVKIYPNPSNDRFKIFGIEKAEIAIYDISGKLILSQNNVTEETEINIENLSKGFFYIKIVENNFTNSKVLIKE